MKRMVTPSADIPYSERHNRVVSAKQNIVKGVSNTTKSNLLSLEREIISRYTLFERAISNNTLFSFPEDAHLITHRDDLLSCYTGRTAKVKEIFKLIEGNQSQRFLKRCPYCGVTLPKTYDHYLPETKYPELSVHALNLVPCCGTCNQKKNNFWKNSIHRTFLHFYSDIIPDSQYISVNLYSTASVNSVGVQFAILRPANVQNSIWDVLAAHYEKLDLIVTYNELANDETSEVFNACVSHLRCGGSNINSFINELMTPEEQLYGSNHWRVVLMRALSTSQDFSTAVYSAI